MVSIRSLGPDDGPQLRQFLSAKLARSMFLLSNLRAAGLEPSTHRFAGHYVGAFHGDSLVGVACHYTMGNLILNAGDHAAALASAALAVSERPLRGIVGPEADVDRALTALELESHVELAVDEREGLYRLDLDALVVPAALRTAQLHGRAPTPADFETLVEWTAAYCVESIGRTDNEHLRAEIRADLPSSIAQGHVWVLERDGELVAKTGFNAQLPAAVQIGGVWTPPALRGQGYARCVLASHLLAARDAGVRVAILFTGDVNLPAQRAYRALGFTKVGRYRIWITQTRDR